MVNGNEEVRGVTGKVSPGDGHSVGSSGLVMSMDLYSFLFKIVFS